MLNYKKLLPGIVLGLVFIAAFWLGLNSLNTPTTPQTAPAAKPASNQTSQQQILVVVETPAPNNSAQLATPNTDQVAAPADINTQPTEQVNPVSSEREGDKKSKESKENREKERDGDDD